MKLRDKLFVREYFKEYYILYRNKVVSSISELNMREIAYTDFDGIMHRHLSFTSSEEFMSWISATVPRDLYHSCSYYLFPDRPMEDKVWQGSDLIFDIDIDHIPGCKSEKIRICRKCSIAYKSNTKFCDNCQETLDEITIPDMSGYNIARKELSRLVERLTSKIGIKEESVLIYFSGSRGFHVHVVSDDIKFLDQRARIELKDFISYDAFDVTLVKTPTQELIDVLVEATNRFIKQDKVKERIVTELRNQRKINSLVRYLKKHKSIKDGISRYIKDRMGISIDGVVTVDLSRVIRAPYSLHGKTGLVKKKIEMENIDTFFPYRDSIGVKSNITVEVYVIYMPSLIWNDKLYEEIYNSRVTLPRELAIFLLCRGLAYDARRI